MEMKRAVFLDRDGVINELIINNQTNDYEPPHIPKDLILFPYSIEILHVLQEAQFELFLISNQPDYAKGKTTLENLKKVHAKLDRMLRSEGIQFRDYYYCYHHPQGKMPEYSFECECRKPKPFFILKAAMHYSLDLSRSWMVGDRDSDIECGEKAGTKTIMIDNPQSSKYRGSSQADFTAANLKDALQIILHKN
jgi:D-glycero-D-manno-heptose 1,7-bisphosphate phosphatase